MTAISYPFALLASLIETPAGTAKAETPAFLPHWRVVLTNGQELVANTVRPLQEGAAALVAMGICKSPATDRVVLWLDEEGRAPFSPCTVQEAING